MKDRSLPNAFAPGLLTRIHPPIRKAALFRASRLGDFVCATPAFRSLRQALPEAELTLVGLRFAESLAARSPHLDRFIAFPGAPGIAEQLYDARRLGDFYEKVQAEEFDLVIQMHSSGVFSNPIALMFRGRFTAGFVRPGDPAAGLDAAYPYPGGRHEVQKLLLLTSFLGAPDRGDQLEFPITDEDKHAAERLLPKAEGPLIGIHAGAEAKTKRWDPVRFARAASALARSGAGRVVLLGSDRGSQTDPFAWALDAVPVDLRGRTSLGTLGAVISRLAVLLTNDSGPAHIAYALGIPSVTIFGGTSPSEWASKDLTRHRAVFSPIDCRPCGEDTCPIGFECLKQVGVAPVVAAAKQVMGAQGLKRSSVDEPESRTVAF